MTKIKIGFSFIVLILVFSVGIVSFLPTLTESKIKEPQKEKLTKVIFIRYAPEFQRKPCNKDGICDADEGKWCADCKNGGEDPSQESCYDFLAGSKPRWNWVEDYYYSDSRLGSSVSSAVITWEGITSGDIFGNGFFSVDYSWGVYDYVNSVSFGNYAEQGVMGVTAIWFRGKDIYEYDILLDTDYFPDGPDDLDTVVLHEFGHAAGLGDLENAICATEVMYGMYDEIDLDLGTGDTIGIQELYGI